VGSITDAVANSQNFAAINPALSPEQLGFKTAMLTAALFPLAGMLVVGIMKKVEKKRKDK